MIESGDVVRIGSCVRVRDRDGTEQFRIVEPEDANATAVRVSVDSPLARALLGRRVGEQVWFPAPGGELAVTVVEVSG